MKLLFSFNNDVYVEFLEQKLQILKKSVSVVLLIKWFYKIPLAHATEKHIQG